MFDGKHCNALFCEKQQTMWRKKKKKQSRPRNQALQIQGMNKTLAEQEDFALWSLSVDFLLYTEKL